MRSYLGQCDSLRPFKSPQQVLLALHPKQNQTSQKIHNASDRKRPIYLVMAPAQGLAYLLTTSPWIPTTKTLFAGICSWPTWRSSTTQSTLVDTSASDIRKVSFCLGGLKAGEGRSERLRGRLGGNRVHSKVLPGESLGASGEPTSLYWEP